MAINLSNVNISLDEFQKISSGWFNAGEVRLKDEHTLAKVNHHVETWFFSNKEKIDHKEVLAIKQAFVNALSQHGIQGDALARVRQGCLGVCPLFPLAFDHAMTVNFSVSTNLLPRDFSINYMTSNGVQTNTMLHLDINQDGVAREKGIRP